LTDPQSSVISAVLSEFTVTTDCQSPVSSPVSSVPVLSTDPQSSDISSVSSDFVATTDPQPPVTSPVSSDLVVSTDPQSSVISLVSCDLAVSTDLSSCLQPPVTPSVLSIDVSQYSQPPVAPSLSGTDVHSHFHISSTASVLPTVVSPSIQPTQLPIFDKAPIVEVAWGQLNTNSLSEALTAVYNETVHWKPNLFMLPSGQQGKRFMNELTRLFEAFNQQSTLESIAIKAALCMPALLLQKPHRKSKVRDHITCLRRRLDLWDEGNFSSLIMEGNMIQRCFNNTHKKMPNDDARIARTFADLMHKGKIRSATQLLSKKEAKGVLNL
jgi:hypothetical protein